MKSLSAWAWCCEQPRARPSRFRAVRIGEEAGDGAGVPGVIVGGAHTAAGAAGGSGDRNLQRPIWKTGTRTSGAHRPRPIV